jgi:prophage maintenance system killer protein
MFESITIKDIIAINRRFADGKTINESSLLFALERANKSGSWLRACAYLVRAVLIDHVFEEGNKRTAAGIIIGFFEEQNLVFQPEEIAKAVVAILMKNNTSIKTIERVIKNAIV